MIVFSFDPRELISLPIIIWLLSGLSFVQLLRSSLLLVIWLLILLPMELVWPLVWMKEIASIVFKPSTFFTIMTYRNLFFSFATHIVLL